MCDEERFPEEDEEVVQILDDYLAARESGHVDTTTFEGRAGEHVDRFRQYVQLAARIRGLSRLADDDTGQFGRFEKLAMLGAGGSSSVFLAHDPQLERNIALKVMALSGSTTKRKTLAEARSIARLDHPHVVRVFEVGDIDDQAYIAMERVAGISLRDALDGLRALGKGEPEQRQLGLTAGASAIVQGLSSTAARCRLVSQVARALDYCHGAGVIHRDVKPENILIEKDLTPRLVDFGIARQEVTERLDVTGGLRGTPSYFAPEQVDSQSSGASAKSDQFAVGAVLYELLTLEHPFRSESMSATMLAIAAARPVAPRKRVSGLPLDVELITLRALERDPARRYQSLSHLADDLDAFLEHRAVSVRPPSIFRQSWLALRRHWKAVAALVVPLVVWIGVDLVRQEESRREFLRELDLRAEKLEQLHQPQDCRELFPWIANSWMLARAFDDEFVSWFRPTKVVDELDAVRSQAIQRLDALHESPMREIEPSRNVVRFAEYKSVWTSLDSLVAISAAPWVEKTLPAPEPSVNLPVAGRLRRFSGIRPDVSELVEVGDAGGPLERGLDRFRTELDGMPCETEFVVRLGEPCWTPTIRPLDRDVARGMLRLESGKLQAQAGEHSYEGFSIGRHPVTWGELRAVLSADEFKSAGGEPSSDDSAPAIIPWVFAFEYAARVGARLPTPHELWAAARESGLSLPARVKYEWTSSMFSRYPSSRYLLILGVIRESADALFSKRSLTKLRYLEIVTP